MAKQRHGVEPVRPPDLAEFRSEDWPSRWAWEVVRVKWARAQGFRQYKLLPLIQQLTAFRGGA